MSESYLIDWNIGNKLDLLNQFIHTKMQLIMLILNNLIRHVNRYHNFFVKIVNNFPGTQFSLRCLF